MPVFELVKLDEENYSVKGELSFFSINKQSIESFDFLKSATEICIDLAQVTVADSAGLALLIELIKHSKQHDTKLVFKNLPEQLLTLARLCDFEKNQYFI
jgi:phospholipid transport system transporter-binding protein